MLLMYYIRFRCEWNITWLIYILLSLILQLKFKIHYFRTYVHMNFLVCCEEITVDAGLLARSQYSESPATGHLDTGFSWFPCV